MALGVVGETEEITLLNKVERQMYGCCLYKGKGQTYFLHSQVCLHFLQQL